jgi:hypothetical protein
VSVLLITALDSVSVYRRGFDARVPQSDILQ